MRDFIPLSINDRLLFEEYQDKLCAESYEYSFHSLYLWRNFSNVKYSIIDDILIVEKKEHDKGSYFMEPMGYTDEDLPKLIYNLQYLQKIRGNDFLFGDVEENFINKIKTIDLPNLKIIDDVDHFEYIYSTKELIELKGKKYSAKKNHCSIFKRLYQYEIKEINTENIIYDCMKLVEKWKIQKGVCCKEIMEESSVIKEVLFKLDLLNLKSIAIYVDTVLVGFSIGGYIKEKSGVIHIEKADSNFKGIYQFLNREFLKKDFINTEIINRQEDCGVEGLRTAKKSYHPINMLKKFLVRA